MDKFLDDGADFLIVEIHEPRTRIILTADVEKRENFQTFLRNLKNNSFKFLTFSISRKVWDEALIPIRDDEELDRVIDLIDRFYPEND